jgi:hypothetical protein
VLIVAAEGMVLLQTPPVVAHACAIVLPGQTVLSPVIDAGATSTVAVIVLEKTGLVVTQPTLLFIRQLMVLPLASELLV